MSDTQAQVEILDKPAPLTAFDPIEAALAKLREEAEKTIFDVTTTAGDKTARELRQRCIGARTATKEAYEAWNRPVLAMQQAARDRRDYIFAEVKKIEEPIDKQIKAEEERRAAIKAAKEAEELRRQQEIQSRINALTMYVAKAVGKSSMDILALRDDLADLPITPELYAHRAGEAMQLQAETAAKLDELHGAALAQEQEQARLAAERAEAERKRQEEEAQARASREAEEARMAEERKAFEAQQARAKAERDAENARQEAARAEQARKDAEAAAALKKQQDEAAAALRAEQERLDKQRREFEEQQEAARRAEQERLDAIEREEQERVVAAARAEREREEAEARAKQEKEEAERRAAEEAARTEIRAARMAPEHTGGNWKIGRGGAVVTDVPIPGITRSGHDDVEYYGGHLIAESIWRPADARLLAAAPRMLALLKLIVEQVNDPANADHTLSAFAYGARIAEAQALIAENAEAIEEPTTA
jgi:IgA-specific serine endopeptidase